MVGKNEVIVQDTKERKVDDIVTVDVEPTNIQIMKKEVTSNVFADAWINKNNQVVISDTPFDCDLTSLLRGSHVNEDGYLVSTEGKKYDLNDADVIADVSLKDVDLVDGFDQGQLNGIVIASIFKGDHYSVLVRTEEEEDFIIETDYLWNENDQVSISIKPNKIKLTLKGDIKKYELD